MALTSPQVEARAQALQAAFVEAARRNDAKSSHLYTRAFIAFLAYKEGHYAVRPATLTLPAAAFEPLE